MIGKYGQLRLFAVDQSILGQPPRKSSTTPVSLPVSGGPQQQESYMTMVAEAGYYNAEKRSFIPGYDFLDWVEAEKQINSYYCAV